MLPLYKYSFQLSWIAHHTGRGLSWNFSTVRSVVISYGNLNDELMIFEEFHLFEKFHLRAAAACVRGSSLKFWHISLQFNSLYTMTVDVTFKNFRKVLQYVAVCCSVLQCVAVCCSVLQRDAAWCSVLQHVAARFSVLQCVAIYCSVLQCAAECCSVGQSVAVCVCDSVQFTKRP